MEYAATGLLIAFFAVAVVLGPLFGADSRDGRDWRPTGPRPERKRPGVVERARRQVALWDAYLTANQPWHEAEPPHDDAPLRDQGPLRWRRVGGEWLLEGDTPPELPAVTPRTRDTGSVAGTVTGSATGPADDIDGVGSTDSPDGIDDVDGDLDDGRGLRVGPPHDGS